MRYRVTETDTFGGELNYSWVNRYEFDAPADAAAPLLVRRAKRAAGWSGRHTTEDYGDTIIIKARGACIAMTVEARA